MPAANGTALITHRRSLIIRVSIASAVVAGWAASSSAVTVTASGSFRAEIDRQKSLAFGNASNLYVQPTAAQQTAFQQLAAELWTGNYQGIGSTALDAQAAGLGYEHVRFNDTDTGQVYYGLREVLVNGAQTKGWGNFWANFGAASDALVEVPHTLFDINTEDLGARTFQSSASRGFIMAGAHRNANGFGTADVARVAGGSMFNVVHQAWNGTAAQTTAWQIHGFDLDGIPSFPADTGLVVSNGDGQINQPTRDLNVRFEHVHSAECYAYNTLSPTNPLNVEINNGIDGRTFDDLGATGNDQGEYSRAIGGAFMHVEFDQPYRFETTNRILTSQVLSDSIRATGNITPSGIKRWDAGASATSGSWTTASGANWSANGLPVASDTIVFDHSLASTLPSAMTLTAQNMTIRGLVWDSNQSSTLASATTGWSDSVIHLLGTGPTTSTPLISIGASATSSTFTINGGNSSTGSGEVELLVAADGAINVQNAGATCTLNCVIRENLPGRRLQKTGAGTLILGNGSNTISGGWELRGGAISIASIAALGMLPTMTDPDYLHFDGGRLRYTGAGATIGTTRGITVESAGGTIDVANSTATLTYNGLINGSGVLSKSGTGTLQLGAASSFNSIVQIVSGRLAVSADGALGSAAGVTIVSGGTLELRSIDYLASEVVQLTGPAALESSGTTSRFNGYLSVQGDARLTIASSALSLPNGITGGTVRKAGEGELLLSAIRATGLSIEQGSVVLMPGATMNSDAGTSRLDAISLSPDASLDLTNNALVIDYPAVSPLDDVTNLIARGYEGGTWEGSGIGSTFLHANSSLAIGIGEAAHLSVTSFHGQPVDETAVLLSIVRIGDADLSGRVDFSDLLRLAQNYGSISDAYWFDGDFNYDGAVGFDDLLALAQHYEGGSSQIHTGDQFWADWHLAQSLVPEPGSLFILAWATGARRSRS